MSTFFTEFESLLEFHISANINQIFVVDFNIHIDDLNDVNSIHFLKLLNTLIYVNMFHFRPIILVMLLI